MGADFVTDDVVGLTLSVKGAACDTDHKSGRCNPLLLVKYGGPHISDTCVRPQ